MAIPEHLDSCRMRVPNTKIESDPEWVKSCQDKIKEMRWMFAEEKSRLEDMIKACDRLKLECKEKLGTLDIFEKELNQHDDYLKSRPHPLKRQQQGLEYIGHRIDDLHETSYQKCRLTRGLHDSVMIVSFYRSDLDSKYLDDELFLDFSQDSTFTPALLIASRAIQDVIVRNIVNHPDPEYEETEEDAMSITTLAAGEDVAASSSSEPPRPPPSPPQQVLGSSSSSSSPKSDDSGASPATAAVCLTTRGGGATWSDISKINCPVPVKQLEKIFSETNRPHCFFDISARGAESFRIVIRVRPDKAPYMSENFIQLCQGKQGFGYKGSKFFRCKGDDHVVTGDFENNDGSGGRSAFNTRLFLAEQCPLKDHKGAVRMRGMERTIDGRCKVGSQFMIWVGDILYKEYKYTLVFGEVTQGLEQLQDISRIGMMFSAKETWLLKEDVVIVNCGVL